MKNEMPMVIYLDQNKWIDLARAYHDRPGGSQYKSVLQKIIDAVESKKAILPLSAQHIIETRKELNFERRKRLAKVMAEISHGITIAPQGRMARWELASSLGNIFQQQSPNIPSPFGIGIPFAFGMGNVIKDKNGNRVSQSNDIYKTVNKHLALPETMQIFLLGTDENTNIDAVKNYNKSLDDLVRRVENFRTKVKKQNKSIHQRAYMADLTVAIQDNLSEALHLYGKKMEDFINLGRESIISTFENCPSLDTEIALAVSRNQQWDKKVHINDSTDIAFLSVATPYCDVVITEKFWKNLARQTKLTEKYNTLLLNDLKDVEEIL